MLQNYFIVNEWNFWPLNKFVLNKNCLFLCAFKNKWSRGRVVRQSSAKASTAVRIRSGPLIKNGYIIV